MKNYNAYYEEQLASAGQALESIEAENARLTHELNGWQNNHAQAARKLRKVEAELAEARRLLRVVGSGHRDEYQITDDPSSVLVCKTMKLFDWRAIQKLAESEY